jgi:hypothetical protein
MLDARTMVDGPMTGEFHSLTGRAEASPSLIPGPTAAGILSNDILGAAQLKRKRIPPDFLRFGSGPRYMTPEERPETGPAEESPKMYDLIMPSSRILERGIQKQQPKKACEPCSDRAFFARFAPARCDPSPRRWVNRLLR